MKKDKDDQITLSEISRETLGGLNQMFKCIQPLCIFKKQRGFFVDQHFWESFT